MFALLTRLLDWGRRLGWLWTILATSGLVGIVTGWIAKGTSWLSQYGAIAWWMAGLVGFFLSAIALTGIAWLRLIWIRGSATRKWKHQVDNINPLARDFNLQRIKVLDLANPVSRKIENKTLTDCELFGPANIAFINRVDLYNVGFFNCDIVAVRADAPLQNVVAFFNTKMRGGAIFHCTIYVPPNMLHMLLNMPGAFSVSLTGDPQFDNRPLPKMGMSA